MKTVLRWLSDCLRNTAFRIDSYLEEKNRRVPMQSTALVDSYPYLDRVYGNTSVWYYGWKANQYDVTEEPKKRLKLTVIKGGKQ